MRNFKKILFVTRVIVDDSYALKQAISLASNNRATLQALIICADLPKSMLEQRDSYESFLKQKLQQNFNAAVDDLGLSNINIPFNIQLDSGNAQGIKIIKQVLNNQCDLVIKAVEDQNSKGFKSIDMELLRKCPCPVWLSRNTNKHQQKIHVAVAIDPDSKELVAHDLSIKLLSVSRELANLCDKQLGVIACWDYVLEEFIRDSVFFAAAEDDLDRSIEEEKVMNQQDLAQLIRESKINGDIDISLIRGQPDQIIPKYTIEKNVDILVMGTVARTGIQGFTFGNTAENVVQKLNCSLLALKPQGFISPVKPD